MQKFDYILTMQKGLKYMTEIKTKQDYDELLQLVSFNIYEKKIGVDILKVSEVLRIPKNVTEAPSELVAGIESDYITAVGKLEDRLLILLDLNKVFNTEQIELLGSMN